MDEREELLTLAQKDRVLVTLYEAEEILGKALEGLWKKKETILKNIIEIGAQAAGANSKDAISALHQQRQIFIEQLRNVNHHIADCDRQAKVNSEQISKLEKELKYT